MTQVQICKTRPQSHKQGQVESTLNPYNNFKLSDVVGRVRTEFVFSYISYLNYNNTEHT